MTHNKVGKFSMKSEYYARKELAFIYDEVLLGIDLASSRWGFHKSGDDLNSLDLQIYIY